MREELKRIMEKAIIYQFKLPNKDFEIEESCYSTSTDRCFSNENFESIADLIYNGIVDYANNEYKIDFNNLNIEQRKAILSKIRYVEEADESAKQSYGFYGEVILYCILKNYYHSNVLVAKGYFVNPTDNMEPTGYDSYHIIQKDNKVQLWFGEVKFHKIYSSGINSVLKNLGKAMSSTYLNRNMISVIKQKDNFTTPNLQIEKICSAWDINPDVNIVDEVNKYDMELVYPILIIFDEHEAGFEESIKKCIKYIKKKFEETPIIFTNTFKYKLFFVFLTVKDTNAIKKKVIEWISTREPLK